MSVAYRARMLWFSTSSFQSGDLVWTTTFSSLTENTEIASTNNIVSYGVFFALTWQLWAAQAAYDIKFYTHDWCHRIFFVFQLLIYGSLAAFTADFDGTISALKHHE
jgi:hypothetical protein